MSEKGLAKRLLTVETPKAQCHEMDAMYRIKALSATLNRPVHIANRALENLLAIFLFLFPFLFALSHIVCIQMRRQCSVKHTSQYNKNPETIFIYSFISMGNISNGQFAVNGSALCVCVCACGLIED